MPDFLHCSGPGAAVRVCCDSLVALPPKTRHGRAIFAKNSDRPAGEPQPLLRTAAADHAPGTKLQCQYVELDQVPHTYALLGSRPAWLWGLEQGLNEHGVAIGNHTIFTRDGVAETGLLGMDLVRLGLERGATAAQAAETIIELIERHGQGGSGYSDTHWPYNNSFLIADAQQALLLEASASRWALKQIDEGASASNHVTIGEDWTRLAHDTIEHAVARSWWPEPTGVRFDFARAYRDLELAPSVISSGRYGATCRALSQGGLDVASVMRVLRDHYDDGEIHRGGRTPEDERYFSVCMHADPVGTTTASMVAELDAASPRSTVYWAALGSPCIAPYVPLFVDAEVPAELAASSMDRSRDGAWWRFKDLLTLVEQDRVRRAPYVRAFWSEHEAGLLEETARFSATTSVQDAGQKSEFVAHAWHRVSRALEDLTLHVAELA